jgi:hypothetical protein
MTRVAETGHGPAEQTPSMGCSIKWHGTCLIWAPVGRKIALTLVSGGACK